MNRTEIEVTEQRPCRHCGKPDWCYYYEDSGLEVCNREQIAPGWKATSKTNSLNRPILTEEKVSKPKAKLISTQKWDYPDREGRPLAKAVRKNFDDGSKKPSRQGFKNGRWVNSCKHIDRSDIPIYKYQEIRKAIENGLQIFWVEGEKCADALWKLGIPATTNFGGSSALTDSDLADLEEADLIICPDQDEPGIKLAEKVYKAFPNAQWLYAFPSSKSWNKDWIPPSNGTDIFDWIEEKKLSAENIYDAIEPYRGNLLPEKEELFPPEAEQHYTEKAIEALYSDGHYIALENDLYKFNGKFYEKLLQKKEQRRIADWSRSNPVHLQGDRWKFSHASPNVVNNIWNWLVIRFGVDRSEINPSGLNLSNGVLVINIDSQGTHWELTPHSPDKCFTYLVDVEYNPQANPEGSDKLLSCLEPPEQEIFLRTLAASLDLGTFRAKTKHRIRGLLLQGEGNNGKDSLREITSLLFGESMVSLGFQDFKNYDQGNQNSLVSLVNSKICWSSENSQFVSLENCQSLKQAITGEPLVVKYLYENPQETKPQSVLFFNCNEAPSLSGGSEAILSRWAMLRFKKVYKPNPKPELGELQADQRFRYDGEFLKTQVAPGLLNKILERLPLVLKEGIDYEPTHKNIEELQEDSNHLWGFIRDMGITEESGGKLYLKELWSNLKQWYQDTGSLEVFDDGYGKEKTIWHDQVNPYDKTIKGPNQIYKRFKELFPKVKKMREASDPLRKNQAYLLGLTQTASPGSPSFYTAITASPTGLPGEAVGEAVSQLYVQGEPGEAVYPKTMSDENLAIEVVKRFSYFSPELQHNLMKELTELYNSLDDDSPSEPQGEPYKVKFNGEIYLVKKSYGDQFVLTYPGRKDTICMPPQDKCEVIEWR